MSELHVIFVWFRLEAMFVINFGAFALREKFYESEKRGKSQQL